MKNCETVRPLRIYKSFIHKQYIDSWVFINFDLPPPLPLLLLFQCIKIIYIYLYTIYIQMRKYKQLGKWVTVGILFYTKGFPLFSCCCVDGWQEFIHSPPRVCLWCWMNKQTQIYCVKCILKVNGKSMCVGPQVWCFQTNQ